MADPETRKGTDGGGRNHGLVPPKTPCLCLRLRGGLSFLGVWPDTLLSTLSKRRLFYCKLLYVYLCEFSTQLV